MALQSRNKVDASFSMSSMTDIVFLLLIFFMVTSTLIAPNALKLLLPESNNQTSAKPITTVSIKDNGNGNYAYYVGTADAKANIPFNQIEGRLRQLMENEKEPTVSLHADKSVPIEEVVRIMNIAKNNEYKLILATKPLN